LTGLEVQSTNDWIMDAGRPTRKKDTLPMINNVRTAKIRRPR
jgi:hypothetical protein